AFGRLLEAFEDAAPAAGAVHGRAGFRRALAHALQVAVFELDLGAAVGGRFEQHLDLGQQVGVVGPLAVDPPGQQQAVGRLPGEHLAPVVLVAVLVDAVPAAAPPGLDDRLLQRRRADGMALWPPAVEALGEYRKSPLWRRRDGQ